MNNSDLLPQALKYCKSRSLRLDRNSPLGHGTDGAVWRTSRKTALKAMGRKENFAMELACYQKLQLNKADRIGDFAVPWLIDFDETLLAIEMTIVEPPYVLDFGKAYVEKPRYYFDKQYMQNLYAEVRGNFGQDFPVVMDVIDTLRTQHGIYYVDPKPTNINTGRNDDDDDDWMRDEQPPPGDDSDLE